MADEELTGQAASAEVTRDYANVEARAALDALMAEPSFEKLAEFLTAIREGYLVADVTGSGKKRAARFRTIRSTKGQLVLPLFTSMAELRLAVPARKREEAKGAVLPALDALRLIHSSPFVAVQFDAGSAQFVVLRKFIEIALSGEEIDPAQFEE